MKAICLICGYRQDFYTIRTCYEGKVRYEITPVMCTCGRGRWKVILDLEKPMEVVAPGE